MYKLSGHSLTQARKDLRRTPSRSSQRICSAIRRSPEERSHRLDMEPIVEEKSVENVVSSKDSETYLVAMFINTGFEFEITSFETYPKRDAVTLYLKEPEDIDGYKVCEMSTHLSNVVIMKCCRE